MPSLEPSSASPKTNCSAPVSSLPLRWVTPGAGRTSGERSHYFEPQAKAIVSSPQDSAEREADAVAHRVMRSAEPAAVGARPTGAMSSPAASGAVRTAQRGGEPLPGPIRRYFEPRFGQDLSRVRVHTDGEAAEASRAIRATAYTVDDHIVFAQGRYAPETPRGRELLAHELTHVVQQRAGAHQSATLVQRQEDSGTPSVTPLYSIASSTVRVPQGHGGEAGSVDTDTFFVRLPATIRVRATARYSYSTTNPGSNWSVQVFRSPWWGAPEPKSGRIIGNVGDTIDFSTFLDVAPSTDFFLRLRNASQYDPIDVSYTVTG